MILLNNICLSFGERVLFDHINLTLSNDDKVGLVGKNGAGKSTLLKAIADLTHVDGVITIDSETTIAYMPQDIVLNSTKSVYDESFSVFQKYIDIEAKITHLEHELTQQPTNAEKMIEEYCELQQELADFDKATAISQTQEILSGLGFSEKRKEQSVDTLSVGWKMRVVLAKLLLQNADFYLFDEPTNHLDLVTKEWFLEFLKRGAFGYLLITHDRHFLENGCDKIFELERGLGTLYYGNYTTYMSQKEERSAVLESAYERQRRDIKHRTEIIDRFKGKASKAKMAQSMIKKLDKMEKIELPPEPPKIHVHFPPLQQPGKTVLTVTKVSHSFDDAPLFKNASCEIKRGEKVALIAPNGCGKTTLFNLITGKIPLQTGSVEFGYNVKTAFFEQDQTKVLNPKSAIFDEIQQSCPDVADGTIRAFLGSFLFRKDDAFKKISVLSGGEKNRVAMVKVLLQNANFLLLDEPTNHLDIDSQDALLDALKRYQGTILIVSHDHSFIQALADHILELNPDGLYSFPGTYQEYLDHKKMVAEKNNPTPSTTSTKNSVEKSNAPLTADDQKRHAKKLEATIAKKEQELEKINFSFADLDYGTPAYDKALKSSAALKKEIDQLTAEWEALDK